MEKADKDERPSIPESQPVEVNGKEKNITSGDMDSKLRRANRVIQAAKKSIDELKRRLEESKNLVKEKDDVLEDLRQKNEKLVEIAKKQQEKISNLEQSFQTYQNTYDNDDSDDEDGHEKACDFQVGMNGKVKAGVSFTPSSVLRRVLCEGISWCLVSDRQGSSAWIEELEVYRLIGDEDLPFELPSYSISEEESAEAQEKIESLEEALKAHQEKFRRFRVRAEMVSKKKDAEIARVTDNNLKYKQHNIVGQDIQAELNHARKQIKTLSVLQGEQEIKIKALNARLKKKSSDLENESAKVKSLERAQSRRLSREESVGSVSETGFQSAVNVSQAPVNLVTVEKLTEQLSKMKREYDKYRERVAEIIQKKDEELGILRKGPVSHVPDPPAVGLRTPRRHSSLSNVSEKQFDESLLDDPDDDMQRKASKADVDLAYLRNIILKYMTAHNDPDTREHMEAAIATVLQFSKEDVSLVKEKRSGTPSPWKFFQAS